MERSDLPAIADLFTRTFRKNNRVTDSQLAGYLETVFFSSPFYTPDAGSIVHLNETSAIDSAILAMPEEFNVHGRTVTAKILCAFMAEGKTGAAGAARLARMMRAARQDFLLFRQCIACQRRPLGRCGGIGPARPEPRMASHVPPGCCSA